MSQKDWYTGWFNSPFYHKLYFQRDEKEAAAFIQKLISHLKPPLQSRMLDVACGRGRHSKMLASLGYHVTGIDISPESIAYARKFENEQLDFLYMICGFLFGAIILIMPLISLPASVISKTGENMIMPCVPLPMD
jgi:SAM-dependent methyltransferase